MQRCFCFLALLAFATGALPADDDVTFKSDIALSRVDVQVTDRNGRALTELGPRDFVLRVDGKVQPIKNFATENMPIDILLLLDVSGSMQPHVQRIADAARQAFNVLAEKDRIAIMVFDTRVREKLPFTGSRDEAVQELNHIVRREGFNGGTRITGSLIEAAGYVRQHARADARRAIVVLTDDETQDSQDEPRVEGALNRANAVLSFLQAPYDPPVAGPLPGRGRRGGYPGGGGGIGFPGGGGGIGFPGGGWPGGGGIPGGGGSPMDPSHTAGTDTIARDSGGDVMSVNDASALEDTLARLRQRYTLNFYLAGETQTQAQHDVRVDLSTEARIRFADADVRSRRVFMSGGTNSSGGTTVVSHQAAPVESAPKEADYSTAPASTRRRVAVNEDSSGPTINTIPDSDSNTPASTSTANPSTAAPASASPQSRGGWPSATPDHP